MNRTLRSPLVQGLLLLAPAVLVYAIFAFYPMLDVIQLSFQSWNGLTPTRQFVGLSNYQQIFTADPVFWIAFRNTVIWTILSVIVPPLIGFGLAIGLNQPILTRAPLRAIYYLPVIIAPIAVATMWRWMYDPFFGLFVQVLTGLNLTNFIVDWLGDAHYALYSMFVAYVWQSVGFSMVLFLAGLQNIRRDVYEAAAIDGATGFTRFWHITLPLLSPMTFFVLIISIIGSFQVFELVYVMTKAGPSNATNTLVFFIYQNGFMFYQMGIASAAAMVLFLIVLVLTLVQYRLQNRWVHYE